MKKILDKNTSKSKIDSILFQKDGFDLVFFFSGVLNHNRFFS